MTTRLIYIELLGRIVQGNIVIDKERIQFGDKIVGAVAIYQIENNKIKRYTLLDNILNNENNIKQERQHLTDVWQKTGSVLK